MSALLVKLLVYNRSVTEIKKSSGKVKTVLY